MEKKRGKALVVGAGISGIRSALDLAETGYGVTLIDRNPHLGGILSQLDYQFPTNRCGMCKMLPMLERDAASQYCLRKGLFHENIDILLSTELVSIAGEVGKFNVTLRQKPTWVDPDLCTGCGLCAEVCAVEVPDAFNAGLTRRKAIYLPVPHQIPNSFVIDSAVCTNCGECVRICPTQAIQLSKQRRRSFRILVVDDEFIIRDSLKEWLDDEGFSVDMAESGPAALTCLDKQHYHLLLSDIKMPGMDGVELLKLAKESHPELCVVMMTAYATVDTAVEAMKIGALDYLMKPFDPDSLIPMIIQIYEDRQAARDRELEVAGIILSGGTNYFNPSQGKDVYAYTENPNVVTSIEFERIVSGTGPSRGRLLRPGDNQAVKKIAWFQCIGSRDTQVEAGYCSSICCMYAIKEAMIAKRIGGREIEAVIFYMDMRTFGKSFQRYRDAAQNEYGVSFERARVHTVTTDLASGDPVVRYMRMDGSVTEERFDMVVLSVGQRPTAASSKLAESTGISLNPWQFLETIPFSATQTQREGIFVGGSCSGLKDISESVTYASAASVDASRVIHKAGGSLALAPSSENIGRDVSRENPNILVALCTCGDRFPDIFDTEKITRVLQKDRAVGKVITIGNICTSDGWDKLTDTVIGFQPNRILIGACNPYIFMRQLRKLSRTSGLDNALIEVVDLKIVYQAPKSKAESIDDEDGDRLPPETDDNTSRSLFREQLSILKMSLARLKGAETGLKAQMPVSQQALIVGGGIAGMTAALALADLGYPVHLVEQTDRLGGNLLWLQHTIEGHPVGPFLEEMIEKTEKHPLIRMYKQSKVMSSFGQVGNLHTVIEDREAKARTIEHGIVILATGGHEAPTDAYAYGRHSRIVTQKEFEERVLEGEIAPKDLQSAVFIQCVGSREEPRNYCSRICCLSGLKHALSIKAQNPDARVFIFYRDMMTYGFSEHYYTEARKKGVIFIPYEKEAKPDVIPGDTGKGTESRIGVKGFDPVLRRNLEIETDLVILGTGVVPNLPSELAALFGTAVDQDGFFQEAESKWRPVDSLKEGVFACGLAHSPRSIEESIATAKAAAQRALRILSREKLPSEKVVASVRSSLCALCEQCIEACPYSARMLNLEADQVLVNATMCQGCGTCAAVCPNSASVLVGFREPQMFEAIDEALNNIQFGQ